MDFVIKSALSYYILCTLDKSISEKGIWFYFRCRSSSYPVSSYPVSSYPVSSYPVSILSSVKTRSCRANPFRFGLTSVRRPLWVGLPVPLTTLPKELSAWPLTDPETPGDPGVVTPVAT